MTTSKGQFLLISAIIIGVLLISASSTIAEIQAQEFTHNPPSYEINMIHQEAEKVDPANREERESFKELVDSIPGYTSRAEAWDGDGDGIYNCFNVTLQKPGAVLRMNCID